MKAAKVISNEQSAQVGDAKAPVVLARHEFLFAESVKHALSPVGPTVSKKLVVGADVKKLQHPLVEKIVAGKP